MGSLSLLRPLMAVAMSMAATSSSYAALITPTSARTNEIAHLCGLELVFRPVIRDAGEFPEPEVRGGQLLLGPLGRQFGVRLIDAAGNTIAEVAISDTADLPSSAHFEADFQVDGSTSWGPPPFAAICGEAQDIVSIERMLRDASSNSLSSCSWLEPEHSSGRKKPHGVNLPAGAPRTKPSS